MAKGRLITDLDVKQNNQVVAIAHSEPIATTWSKRPHWRIRIKNFSYLFFCSLTDLDEAKGTSLGTNCDETAMVPIITMANQLVGRRSPYGLPVSFIFAAVKNEPQMKVAQFQVENCDSGTK